MARILVPYGTTEGQTATIAEFIAGVIRDCGHEATPVELTRSAGPPPDGYDGVIVGASVHMGRHDKHAVRFVQENRDALDRLPSALFSVSLAAHGDVGEARGYVEQFEEQTGWRPDTVALVAGALLYTRYGFLKRHLMRRIARDKPGHLGVDTSRDYVYTEWDAVRLFAERFVSAVTATTPT